MEDKQLIENYLQKGNEESLGILISRYLKPAYRFVRRYSGNPADADDIVQETFLKAWKNLKKFNTEKSFHTWIFSIAKNTAIDFLKKKKPVSFSAMETIPDSRALPNELSERALIKESIGAAISKLMPKYRTVVSLHHESQLTFSEIAKFLSEPLNTVKSRYRRALALLKKLV